MMANIIDDIHLVVAAVVVTSPSPISPDTPRQVDRTLSTRAPRSCVEETSRCHTIDQSLVQHINTGAFFVASYVHTNIRSDLVDDHDADPTQATGLVHP